MNSWIILTSIIYCIDASSDGCCFSVHTETRQIIDNGGRARLFHGVNVVVKSFPYHPDNSSFDPERSLSDEDVNFLVDQGFNVVRLYVAWPGVEPQRDRYNITYLNVLNDFVEKLGRSGIYTILDCHQDVLSPKFCGEGVPDYAALYMNRSIKSLPFPEIFPQLTPFRVDPTTGYPYRNECTQHQFFTYYFSDAVGKAWQSLYDDEQNVQERFTLFWSKVSEHFANNPYVLGYELINEPWAGDIYRHPDQAEPHIADKKNLQPMYSNLFKAISQYDEGHLIFFEPTVAFTSLPDRDFSSTGLTEGPGGPEHLSRQVFSYHMYCIIMDKNGQPLDTFLCDLLNEDIFDIRISDQTRLGVAGFMTEWGAYTNVYKDSKTWKDAIDLMNLADEHLQSWTYWQFKGYGDFTTQSNDDEGLYYKNGTLQTSKVKLLSRTYAQAVSGQYISQSFDTSTGLFQLVFQADTTVHTPTEIYLNEKLYYPNGFDVSVAPEGYLTMQTKLNKVLLSQTARVPDRQTFTVKISRK